jgi:hypothetical protein
MNENTRFWRRVAVTGGAFVLLLACYALFSATSTVKASGLGKHCDKHSSCDGEGYVDDFEGTWYWLRSPEEEKRVAASLFSRYCIRCHGGDGRGVWDIPDVPDFTNGRWQGTRSDAQLARVILEGRGAVMPRFRGTLTLEESWAMARYLRTLIPGTEMSKPDTSKPEAGKSEGGKVETVKPAKLEESPKHR